MTKREADYLTWLFNRTRRRLPLRGSLSSAFGAPLLQGATQQSCKKPTLRKISSRPSSFRAQREIFLAQQSSGERQMRSSRSAHAILSLPHKYRVPLRRKRSLGYARDDETREADYLTWLFIRPRRRLPLRGSLSSAFGAPLLQGATQQSCKKPTLRKVSSRPSSFRAQREIFLAHRSSDEREMRSST